jgi:hypothetical protein
MRNQCLIILVLIAKIGFGQATFSGKYESGSDFVNFLSDSTLEFKVLYGAGLGTYLYGYGEYKIKKDKIKLKTIEHSSEFDAHYGTIKSLNDSTKIEFYIEDLTTQPIQYCYVVLREMNAKKIDTVVISDELGFAVLRNLENAKIEKSLVELMSMGFETVTIPLKEVLGKSVKVVMSEYNIVTDKKVFFEIRNAASTTQIVGPEFHNGPLGMHKIWRTTSIVFTTWPWNWKQTFKYNHEAESKIFEKK